MGSMSNAYEGKMLDAILGSAHSADFPATVFLALFTTAPTDSTFGVEVAGGSYTRQAITNNDANWADAVASVKSNVNAVTFPTATGAWGTVAAWALMDHITTAAAANIICYGAVGTPTPVSSGETATFPAGSITLTGD